MGLPRIALDECVAGDVYLLYSRNLSVGVYDGSGGFIGIRGALGATCLDREYHCDSSDRRGTARPLCRVGRLDASVELREALGSVCHECGLPVVFARPADGSAGRWDHDVAGMDHDPFPVGMLNRALLAALAPFEELARQSS